MLVSKLDIMIPIQHILLVLLCYFICLHGPVNLMKVHLRTKSKMDFSAMPQTPIFCQ